MAVRRDRKGQWRYRKVVMTPDGEKLRVSGTPQINTKAEAEAAERAHIERLLHPKPIKKEVPTFQEFVEKRWWPVYPDAAGNRPSTVKEKADHIRLHLMPALGNVPLDHVRGEVVDKLIAGLRAKGLREKSRKNIRATLRRILQSAVDWGVLDAMPALPKVRVPQASFDFYTMEEGETLIAATRTNDERTLLLFALHTGARAGEQLAIEWGDVDFVNRVVVIRRSRWKNIVGPTKSGRERRVPMTATLEAALKAIRHLRSGLVFCNGDGSPMTLWQLHERLWGASRRAGLRKIRWHDLRHSYGSQLAIAGVPVPQIKAWMGHADITTTMRYAHLSPNGQGELVRVLDRPWQPCGNEEGLTKKRQ